MKAEDSDGLSRALTCGLKISSANASQVVRDITHQSKSCSQHEHNVLVRYSCWCSQEEVPCRDVEQRDRSDDGESRYQCHVDGD